MNNFEIINVLKQIQLADRNKKTNQALLTAAVVGLTLAVIYYTKNKKAADDLLIYRNRYYDLLKKNVNTSFKEVDKIIDHKDEFTEDEQN